MEYIKSQSGVLSPRDVKNYLKALAGVDADQKSIIVFMKNTLRMTYKRVSSRPVMKSPENIIIKKILFWIKYTYLLNRSMIVNIDETLFSKCTKINYSLTFKWKKILWIISLFSNSLSLIEAITNEGEWFISNLEERNNSEIFVLFVEKLMMWL